MWRAARNCALRWSSRGRSSMKCFGKTMASARQGKARQGKAKQSKAKPCLALPKKENRQGKTRTWQGHLTCLLKQKSANLIFTCFSLFLRSFKLALPSPSSFGGNKPPPPLGGWGSSPPFWGGGPSHGKGPWRRVTCGWLDLGQVKQPHMGAVGYSLP